MRGGAAGRLAPMRGADTRSRTARPTRCGRRSRRSARPGDRRRSSRDRSASSTRRPSSFSAPARPRCCGSALADFVPPHSPVFALVDSVWRIGNTIAEYDVLLEGPRFGSALGDDPGRADRRGGRPARADAARALDRRQDRPPADPSQRRALGHGDGGDAGARGQEPAFRHPRRGAAARAGCRSGRPRADPADLRRDRPHRRAGRPHGGVLRPPADRARARSTSTRCWSACARRRSPASPATSRFVEEYDPSLPPVHGNRDLLVQVFLNLVKNAAEAVPERRRRDHADDRLPARPAPRRSGRRGRRHLPLVVSVDRQRRRHPGGSARRICSIRLSRPSATALASVLHWSPR